MKFKLKILICIVFCTLIVSGLIMLIFEDAIYAKVVIARNTEAENQRILAEKTRLEEERIKNLEPENVPQVIYEEENEYYNGLALVKYNGKYGYIDKSRKVVIDFVYDAANNFDNIARVKKDGKWGYISFNGEEVIPIDYSYCTEFTDGIVLVKKDGKYGLFDTAGNIICDHIYDRIEAFSDEGYAKVLLNQKYGYINKTGKVIVDIMEASNDKNVDFMGVWNKTGVSSYLGATIEISNQSDTKFDFNLNLINLGGNNKFSSTATIVSPTIAKFAYGSGRNKETITFKLEDNKLKITSILDGKLGVSSYNTIMGQYITEDPVYEQEDIVEKLFTTNTLDVIQQVLGKELYNEDFLYALRNGQYTSNEASKTSLSGILYHVWTQNNEKDFKMLINEEYIYFYSNNKKLYRTNDNERKTTIPSAIIFGS